MIKNTLISKCSCPFCGNLFQIKWEIEGREAVNFKSNETVLKDEIEKIDNLTGLNEVNFYRFNAGGTD